MTYLRLFWEFFKTGLFAVGGGMATVPFLKNIGLATGWYSQTDLMNMLAVSESTPGPIGINMATYVGFTVAGILGAVIATIGEVTPSIIVILIVAAMLTKFRNSNYCFAGASARHQHCSPGFSFYAVFLGRYGKLDGSGAGGGAAGAD